MSCIGEWVEFVEIKEKGMTVTNQDLMHGEIVGITEEMAQKHGLKIGQKAIISTVKKMQDLIDGKMHYFVNINSIIRTL